MNPNTALSPPSHILRAPFGSALGLSFIERLRVCSPRPSASPRVEFRGAIPGFQVHLPHSQTRKAFFQSMRLGDRNERRITHLNYFAIIIEFSQGELGQASNSERMQAPPGTSKKISGRGARPPSGAVVRALAGDIVPFARSAILFPAGLFIRTPAGYCGRRIPEMVKFSQSPACITRASP